jgi:hypothetical protein
MRVLEKETFQELLRTLETNSKVIAIGHLPPTTPQKIEDPTESIRLLLIDPNGNGIEKSFGDYLAGR